MMYQVLYIVQLPNEEGDMQHLVHHDMPCDPNLVSSAFIQYLYSLSKLQICELKNTTLLKLSFSTVHIHHNFADLCFFFTITYINEATLSIENYRLIVYVCKSYRGLAHSLCALC